MRKSPFYKESAKCLWISQTFHVCVVGSRDKSLVVHSLERAYHVLSIDLQEDIPRLVAVTETWGFIATAVQRGDAKSSTILLHSLNGDKIREADVSIEVSHLIPFSSRSGFDYLLIANNGCSILVCEAYYLNFIEVRIKRAVKIAYIGYDKATMNIIVVSKSGDVILTPFDPEICFK